MGNPFLFADRFSGAVVNLTTDSGRGRRLYCLLLLLLLLMLQVLPDCPNIAVCPAQNDKMPAAEN
jgi:hypothetical protein